MTRENRRGAVQSTEKERHTVGKKEMNRPKQNMDRHSGPMQSMRAILALFISAESLAL